jgi:hypothetical protein
VRPRFFYHGVMKTGLRAILVVPTLSSLLLTQCVSTPREGGTSVASVSVNETPEQFLQQTLESALEQPLEEPLKKSTRKALKKAVEPPAEKPDRSTDRVSSRKHSDEATAGTYTSDIRLGTVTIMDGTRRVATCRTAAPYVQEARFINHQKQIVVRSRGRHGPATVQLFDSRTGAEKDALLADEIRNGQPAWAAGMED